MGRGHGGPSRHYVDPARRHRPRRRPGRYAMTEAPHEQPPQQNGRVINGPWLPERRPQDAPPLPVPADDRELERYIYEGEVVDGPDAQPTQMLPAPARGKTIVVRPHPGVAKAAKVIASVALTAGQGWHSWQTRAWDGLTLGVYRRAIRQAEAVGDREALAEWVDRMDKAKQARHERLMELPLLAVNLAKTLGVSIVGALMLLLALATAVWATGVGEFSTVWVVAGNVIRFLLT